MQVVIADNIENGWKRRYFDWLYAINTQFFRNVVFLSQPTWRFQLYSYNLT